MIQPPTSTCTPQAHTMPQAPDGWVGPGETAFAGAGPLVAARGPGDAAAAGGRIRWLNRTRWRDLESAWESQPGAPGAARPGGALRRALAEFFRWGGSSCAVLEDPRFGDETFPWAGEDGEPGRRAGLHALAELEGVGTLALVDCPGARRLVPSVRAIARSRPDLLFLVHLMDAPPSAKPPGGSEQGCSATERPQGPVLQQVARNVTTLLASHGLEGGGPGRLLAHLEAMDFRPEAPFRASRVAAPHWLSRDAALYLEACRREQGVIRSVDLTTRWVVFEINHPFLARRVERELTRLFLELADRGLLAPRWPSRCGGAGGRGRGAFEVRCLTSPLLRGEPDRNVKDGGPARLEGPGSIGELEYGRLRVRVRYRLAHPYGTALAAWRPRARA